MRFYRTYGKRWLDWAMAVFALILLAPVFLLCMLALRLTSRGPVFHVSDRIGANNAHFNMLKFRTMRVDTPQVATHLMKNPTAYLTPIGSFLRKTSLDELPQLVNVLKGEMSMVGPRPALFNQDDQISLRTTAGCHGLVPGITGWAQVNGRDDISVERKVELDVWYYHHASFPVDMKILWMTFRNVFSGRDVSH
jgi:O-antigen biosynthesis protein WbqP